MVKIDKENAQAIYILNSAFRWLQRLEDWPHPITNEESEIENLLDEAILSSRPQEEVEFLAHALRDQRERDAAAWRQNRRDREKGI